MNPARPIEIVGGGLAGLSLGLALRRAGIAVAILEAGDYPRHRVCGEFIAGLDAATISQLDLAPILADAARHREVAWFLQGQRPQVHPLPSPALGISRHVLDLRLAEAFVAAGGDLRTHTRLTDTSPSPGRVFATGRHPAGNRWLGLKVHVTGLPLERELELHLGDHAYVGLSKVEAGRVNVCGLFRRRTGVDQRHVPAGSGGRPDRHSGLVESAAPPSPTAPRHAVLFQYLAACGLDELAARLRRAAIDEASFCAVAALHYDRRIGEDGRIQIGDACAMIPPFTGNGMAMAFQSAAATVAPLAEYARGGISWDNACWATRAALRERFASRLGWADALHPFVYRRPGQRWLGWLSRARLLPFRPLYAVLH